jgi:hypothetical protein
MAKMGRPKMAPKERSSYFVGLRLTPAEFKALKQAAGSMKISDYIRSKLKLRGDK